MSRDGTYDPAKTPYEKICEYCGEKFTPKTMEGKNGWQKRVDTS